jgi:hypothetical protein
VPANPPFEARFRSKTHPGSAASGLVFSRLLAPPLAACMIPVMIGALAAALEGYSLWKFLYIGFPGALLVALLWARFRLQATPVEIFVDHDRAAVRTAWDLIRRPGVLDWFPVLDVRRDEAVLTMTLGLDVYELTYDDWPDGELLVEALRQARRLSRLPHP